ncbi:hypothetical protein EON63_15655 [archaeon]|nr:MAG: hypothetical protein EON63_15655 [archaeon]
MQMRGSIPTYWYQETSVTMPKPPILINRGVYVLVVWLCCMRIRYVFVTVRVCVCFSCLVCFCIYALHIISASPSPLHTQWTLTT